MTIIGSWRKQMNKQEAIERIKKQSTQAYDDFAIMRDTAIHIINQIDEPQKPVVPKFVAVIAAITSYAI